MQFLIINYMPTVSPDLAEQAVVHNDMAAWQAYTQAMLDAGVMRGGNALKPSYTATTVRERDGAIQLHDGPYADSKDQLGGYYVIEVEDLDAALKWAARNPAAAHGAVEVRPIQTY